ncbi:LytTR family transcriptional regulator DNA-binding domain-containing protein [Ulvibacterium sp.]|uniref:LytTR family transcriptional regulator DNA-binding domain-containing protein n=1 Tax=Ulvibacterium sp. TaxID=2665914 RepID=UPI003BAA698A
MKPKLGNSKIEMDRIRDKWLFLYVYPIFALLAVHLGNDNGFLKLLGMASYYTDIVFALLCVYGCGLYIRWISFLINKRFGWDEKLSVILRYQGILGLLVPTLFVVLAEWIYLWGLGIQLSESSIFYLEFPLAILLCLLINITYLFMYFRIHNLKVRKRKNEIQKKSFVVKEGSHMLNVAMPDVAYFIKRNKFTFLVTKKGKDYLYDHSFKTIWKTLPPEYFFQLNRQVISCRESIVQCTKAETRRLKIELSPKTDDPVYVAKVHATKFLDWLDNS